MSKIFLYLILLSFSACQMTQPVTPLAKELEEKAKDSHPSSVQQVDYGKFFQNGRYGIFSINLDGSDLKEIASYNKERDQILISPNGKKILFVEYVEDLNNDGLANSEDDKASDLGIMNIDGSEPKILSPSPEIDSSPTFSPDGKFILFSSSRDTGYRYLNLDLYRLDMGKLDSKAERMTKTLRIAEQDPEWIGNTIAYSSFEVSKGTGNAKIITVEENFKNFKTITSPEILGSSIENRYGDYDPKISPDGRYIAFARRLDSSVNHQGRTIGDYDIYLSNRSGTELLNISANKAADLQPNFSPDSKYLAFTRITDHSSEIIIYDIRIKQERKLEIPNWNTDKSHPTFSPDEKLYFVAEKL